MLHHSGAFFLVSNRNFPLIIVYVYQNIHCILISSYKSILAASGNKLCDLCCPRAKNGLFLKMADTGLILFFAARSV